MDERILRGLEDTYHKLEAGEDLIPKIQLEKYFDTFRRRFGPEQLARLDGDTLLEIMYNTSNKDSMVYWLEFKNDEEFQSAELGSIAGGSALKFGIYRRRETGIWMTGAPRTQIELTIEEAVKIARRNKEQLIRGCEILEAFSSDGSDNDYKKLQADLAREAPDIQDTAWGHKYFSIIFPDKLDVFHNPDYQRFYLFKLLEIPPEGDGRYIAAGRYVQLARKLSIPMNHLTASITEQNGNPRRYFRIGTDQGKKWPMMRDGGFVAVGWDKLGDLSSLPLDQQTRDLVKKNIALHYYPNNPQTAGRQGQELFNYLWIKEGDTVVAADGATLLGIGKVTGGYQYKPESDYPHTRPVEWLNLEQWKMSEPVGLQTTVYEIRPFKNIVEIERRLFDGKVQTPHESP